jgi:hypothetical protein
MDDTWASNGGSQSGTGSDIDSCVLLALYVDILTAAYLFLIQPYFVDSYSTVGAMNLGGKTKAPKASGCSAGAPPFRRPLNRHIVSRHVTHTLAVASNGAS